MHHIPIGIEKRSESCSIEWMAKRKWRSHPVLLPCPGRLIHMSCLPLQTGLTILKVAAAVGRLSGVPVPDLGSAVERGLESMVQTVDAVLGEQASTLLEEALEATKHGAEEGMTQLLDAETSDKVNGMMRKSAQELKKLLPEGWEAQTGLVKVRYLDEPAVKMALAPLW